MVFKKIFAAISSKSRSEASPAMVDLTAIEIKDMRSMGQYLNGILFNVAVAFGANQKTLDMLGPINNKSTVASEPAEEKLPGKAIQAKVEADVPFDIPILH